MTGNARIPFNPDNIEACLCPSCPVQDTTCVKRVSRIPGSGPDAQPGPLPTSFPDVYCATGVATIRDLATSLACMCSGCAVWRDYGIADHHPARYSCRDGPAA